MSKGKVAIRRIFRGIKKIGVSFFTILQLLKFFKNIDTVSQFLAWPVVAKIVSFVSGNYWIIALVISMMLIISYCVSYSITYHDPISTGGYFKIYEQIKTEHFYRLRRALEQKKEIASSELHFDDIQSLGTDLCDNIANMLNYNFDEKFAVCIKVLDVTSARVTRSSKEAMLRTFCRGGEDKHERAQSDVGPIPLNANSDFLSIFEGKLSNFCCGNLRIHGWINNRLSKMFPNKFEKYSNTTYRFLEKYLSTIVVPITLSENFMSNEYGGGKDKKDPLLGFLCIDCKKRLSKSKLRKMLPYMEAFSYSLYVFFEEVVSGQETLTNKKRHSSKSPTTQSQHIILRG